MMRNKLLVLLPSSDKVIRYRVEDFAIDFGLRRVSVNLSQRMLDAYVMNSASDPYLLPKFV